MSETKNYQDHLKEAKKNSKINTFIELSQNPIFIEMDKLVRSHVKSHFDAFPEISRKISTNEEYKKQYSEFCRTRDTDDPIIGNKIKPLCEYYLMRRDLERYIRVWGSCLDSYCDDIVLFHT